MGIYTACKMLVYPRVHLPEQAVVSCSRSFVGSVLRHSSVPTGIHPRRSLWGDCWGWPNGTMPFPACITESLDASCALVGSVILCPCMAGQV